MSKETITATDVDTDVMERLYHTKDMQKLLDEVLEDYISQVATMSDDELNEDRSEWMKTIGREKYDDEELERSSQIHTIAIELEQIRRWEHIVYYPMGYNGYRDMKDKKLK